MKSHEKILVLLTIGFLVLEILFNYSILQIGGGDIINAIIKDLLFLLFILLYSKKQKWAKWILSIALILYGMICLLIGIEFGYVLYIVGLYNIFLAIYLLKSKALSSYREFQSSGTQLTSNEEPNVKHYPMLIRRYKALLIDGGIVLTSLIVIMVLIQDSESRVTIMVSSGLIILLGYEPILTAYSKTIGQRLMRIRVGKHYKPEERITLINAYIRWIAKGLLGWLSFVTIMFNPEKRAIHDIASDSIMVIED